MKKNVKEYVRASSHLGIFILSTVLWILGICIKSLNNNKKPPTKLFYKYKAIYEAFDNVYLKQVHDFNAADIQNL